jgi:single-stranded DNA-binding protein
MIECAFDGRLGGPQMVRTCQKGNRWLSLSLAVTVGDEKPEWVSVALFGEVMDSLPDDLVKGERIYVEGRLKVSRYCDKRSGETRANLQVSATRALLLDRIGRRARRPRKREADGQDQGNVVQRHGDDDGPLIPFTEDAA